MGVDARGAGGDATTAGIPGTHVEVYLPEQVAVLFTDGSATLITHISSGEGVEWCDDVTIDNDDGAETTKGICGVSITPGGVYHFEREVEGWRQAALGRLSNVPPRPASRGCVRIPMHIAEYFPDLVSIDDFVFVFDGVEEPEHYGAQLPVFYRPDPSYMTTTTTSTNTTSTTTSSTTTSTTTAVPTTPATTRSVSSTSSSAVPTTAAADHHLPTVPSTSSPTTAPSTTTTTSTVSDAPAGRTPSD